jgi:DNA uptake protein ComE-like DNA-binding protein
VNRSITRNIVGSGLVAVAMSLSVAWAQTQATPPAEQAEPTPPPTQVQRAHRALTAPKGSQVDINHASRTELKTVPGITTALAGRIMANRPFGTKAQLVTRGIISEELYGRLKNRVTVRFTKQDLEKILGDKAPK